MEKKLFENLLEVLEKEYKIFCEVNEISIQKTAAIIDRKIEDLERISKIETNAILQIGVLEDERMKLVSQLSSSIRIEEKNITVSTFIKYADKEMGKKLEHYLNEISRIINELKKTNELNTKLISNSLEYVDFMLNLVTCLPDSSDNKYSSDGKPSTGDVRRLFDQKL